MMSLKKILVPVDFSDGSRAALELAGFLATQLDGTVEVIHVFEPATYFPAVPGPGEAALGQYASIALETSTLELDRFVEPIASANPGRFTTKHIEIGFPMQQIVDRAKAGKFDMIVMGTHGRRGIARLLLGSVASEVIRRASCPVITVRASEQAEEGKVGKQDEQRK